MRKLWNCYFSKSIFVSELIIQRSPVANQTREVRRNSKSLLFFNYLLVLKVLFHSSLCMSHEPNSLDFLHTHFLPKDLPKPALLALMFLFCYHSPFRESKSPQKRKTSTAPSSKHRPSLACATLLVSLNIQAQVLPCLDNSMQGSNSWSEYMVCMNFFLHHTLMFRVQLTLEHTGLNSTGPFIHGFFQ